MTLLGGNVDATKIGQGNAGIRSFAPIRENYVDVDRRIELYNRALTTLAAQSDVRSRVLRSYVTNALNNHQNEVNKRKNINLTPYETNKAVEIKEGANEKTGKVISLKSVNDVYDYLENAISDVLGDNAEYSIDNKKNKARRLFEEFNIAKQASKKQLCEKFVRDLVCQEYISSEYIGECNITYGDYLTLKGFNVEKLIKEGTTILYNALNEKAVASKTQAKINRLEKWIAKHFNDAKEFKAVMQFTKKLNSILKTLSDKTIKYGNTGQMHTKSGIKGLFYQYFSNILKPNSYL